MATGKQNAQNEWDQLRRVAAGLERLKPGAGDELFRVAAASLKAVRDSVQVSAGATSAGGFRR